VVLSVLFYSVRTALAARAANKPTARETPFEPMPTQAA
jgi:carbon starvation protein